MGLNVFVRYGVVILWSKLETTLLAVLFYVSLKQVQYDLFRQLLHCDSHLQLTSFLSRHFLTFVKGNFISQMEWASFTSLFWNTNDSIANLTIPFSSDVFLWRRPCYQKFMTATTNAWNLRQNKIDCRADTGFCFKL